MTETLAEMLPARLCDVACRMESFTSQQLATGVVAQLQTTMPLGIALVHLDAADYTRLTATLRRIRRILPGMPVLTGRWGVQPLTAEECRELTALGATGFIHNPEELKRWLLRQAK